MQIYKLRYRRKDGSWSSQWTAYATSDFEAMQLVLGVAKRQAATVRLADVEVIRIGSGHGVGEVPQRAEN